MAVQPTDLKALKAAAQIGGAITTTAATGVDELFAGGFSGAQSASGVVHYACAYIRNDSAQTAFDVSFHVSSEDVAGTVNVKVALGAAAVNGTEAAVANVTTSPAVTFVEADGAGNALSIGDLLAGEYKSIWFEFTLPAGTSAVDFNYSIKVDAETGV